MKSLKKCFANIEKSKNIAIITHKNFDTDAICSAISLKKIIKENYDNKSKKKIVDIYSETDKIDDKNFIIVKNEQINIKSCKKYDLVISLDCSCLERMGIYKNLYKSIKNSINIDHHITNEHFGKNNIVLLTSSTCEGLYLIFKSNNAKITDEVCKLIYSGIITDTNNLSQGLVTINTHNVISELIDRNINTDLIKEHFFKNNTKSQAYLTVKALQSMSFFIEDKIAFMKITKQDMLKCKANYEDTLGIVDYGIQIKGVEIAILAIKQKDNSYYVSLRSKNNIKVSEVAKEMGGGGHENMAAFQFKGSLVKMKEKLLKYCREELNKSNNELINNIFGV